MMIIRPVKMDDLDNIVELASQAGTGLTTLPHNRSHLKQKIQNSLDAFDKNNGEPLDECYLFVIADSDTDKAVGTSGVVAAVGTTRPFYTYKINKEVHYSESLDVYKKLELLTLTNDFTGASEICTLFLSPNNRGGGNGVLLSKSRFLFIAQFPERFGKKIVAEMRGISDKEGHSPFWESVGRHFFDMDFADADKENGQGNSQFIAELMPHHPIYIPMLSPQAQEVIGKTHTHTKPAVEILKAEGFENTGYVDIFDGGPTIEAFTKSVRTIKESFELPVKIGNPEASETSRAMVANTQLKTFRACLTNLTAPVDNKITISAELAKALLVEDGEKIRVRFY